MENINWKGAFNRFNTPPDAIVASYDDDEQMNTKELETLEYKAPEQPKYDKCQYCGAGRVVRPSGEWQYYCNCDDPIKRPEQPINTGCAAKEDNECECQMCGDTKQIYGDPYGVPCPECVVKSSNLEIIKQIVGCIRVESALLNELRKACE